MTTSQHRPSTVPVDAIVVRDRRRSLRTDDVPQLAATIREVGLINPIIVVQDGKVYRLVTGRHRLEAHRVLGLGEIPAIVRDLDDLDAELIEIDENLARSELTVLEQAEHLDRRDELLRARGARAPGHRPQKGASTAPFQTTAQLAHKVGLSERTAQERLQIARGLSDETRDIIRASRVANSRAVLLHLSHVQDPDEQKDVARHLARFPGDTVDRAQKFVEWERRRRGGRCVGCGVEAEVLVDNICRPCISKQRRADRAAQAKSTRAKNERLRAQFRKFDDQAATWVSLDVAAIASVLGEAEVRSALTRIGQFRGWLNELEQSLKEKHVGGGGAERKQSS